MTDDLDIGADGEFAPYLKFSAKGNEWSWHGEDGAAVLTAPRFAWDIANIQTAWVRFDEGSAPDFVVDPVPGCRAERPSERHKRGFVSRVSSKSSFVGVGEFSSNAVGVCNAAREIYREYKQQAAEHDGDIPVVTAAGSTSFKGRFGTNHAPLLQITGWIKRPDNMPNEPVIPVKPARGGNSTTEVAREAAKTTPPADEFSTISTTASPTKVHARPAMNAPDHVIDRLRKLLGLLGSDHENERAVAGRMASDLLRRHKLTWSDVVAVERPAPRAPVRVWHEPRRHREAAAECLAWPEILNEWELDFLKSISGRWSLSGRQQHCLARIIEKCRHFARASGAHFT
jgi:hypothetical protein